MDEKTKYEKANRKSGNYTWNFIKILFVFILIFLTFVTIGWIIWLLVTGPKNWDYGLSDSSSPHIASCCYNSSGSRFKTPSI